VYISCVSIPECAFFVGDRFPHRSDFAINVVLVKGNVEGV